jgi:hypothetical protein
MNDLAEAKMFWYAAALTFFEQRRQMAPLDFMAAQTITDSAFCTVGTVYFATNFDSPTGNQQRTCPPGLTRKIFSSEKMTRSKS